MGTNLARNFIYVMYNSNKKQNIVARSLPSVVIQFLLILNNSKNQKIMYDRKRNKNDVNIS